MSRRGRNEPLEVKLPISEEDKRKFEEGWTQMMGEYWRERLMRMHLIDTGTLYGSIKGQLSLDGENVSIAHSFAEYGLRVAAGTSPAFKWRLWGHNAKLQGKQERERVGSGQFEFLDPTYRRTHGLEEKKRVGPAWGGRETGGTPKGRRDWFLGKYWSSVQKLNEFEALYYGSAYQGLVASLLQELMARGGGTPAKENRVAVKWD